MGHPARSTAGAARGLDGAQPTAYLSAPPLPRRHNRLVVDTGFPPSNRRGFDVSAAYRVRVSKDYLTFASAHFITFQGHRCETLHGHNYRVAATVEGALDPECQFVIDFGVLKAVLRRLVEDIDHKVLLPTKNPKVGLREEQDRLFVDYLGTSTYVFPVRDCALLPIANTTAEELAAHFAAEVREHLRRDGYTSLTALEIEVEESFGQSATYRAPLP
ncbi:MAG: 6-carboxytetrahydropterin synthase [Gemmatimonadales bacterium]|nr:MAG: 6-carboxytetrahydropterin synthase [Gemmatimonadales bacterium]